MTLHFSVTSIQPVKAAKCCRLLSCFLLSLLLLLTPAACSGPAPIESGSDSSRPAQSTEADATDPNHIPDPSSADASTAVAPESNTASTEKPTDAATEAPTEPDPVPEVLPVRVLPGFDRDGKVIDLLPLDETRFLILYSSFSPDTVPQNRCLLALYDTAQGCVLKEALAGGMCEELVGVRPNGEIVSADGVFGVLSLYGPDLSLSRRCALPGGSSDAALSADGDTLYFISLQTLFEASLNDAVFSPAGSETSAQDGSAGQTDGGETSPQGGQPDTGDPAEAELPELPARALVSFGEFDYLLSYDAARSLVLYVHPAPDYSSEEVILYDYAMGETLWSAPFGEGQYLLHDGQLVTRACRTVPDDSPLHFANHSILTQFGSAQTPAAPEQGLSSAQTPAGLDLGDIDQLWWADGTPYAYATDFYHPADNEYLEHSRLCVIDPEASCMALPDLGTDPLYDFTFCVLPETGYGILSASVYDPDEDVPAIRLYQIDPAQLSYDRELPAAAPDTPENALLQRDINRAALQELADQIHEEYAVTILFGDDATEHSGLSYEYTTRSTDDMAKDPTLSIAKTIRVITDGLAPYRNGLGAFSQNGAYGLRFLIVNGVTWEGLTNFDAGGLFYYSDLWYNILFSIEGAVKEDMLHHELWHAIEHRIEEDSPAAFGAAWQALNPPDFTHYLGDFNTYITESEKWARYILGSGGEAYFISAYSVVTAHEDRATLIGALYDGSLGRDPSEALAVLEEDYPHLFAKLNYLNELAMPYFGYGFYGRAE